MSIEIVGAIGVTIVIWWWFCGRPAAKRLNLRCHIAAAYLTPGVSQALEPRRIRTVMHHAQAHPEWLRDLPDDLTKRIVRELEQYSAHIGSQPPQEVPDKNADEAIIYTYLALCR